MNEKLLRLIERTRHVVMTEAERDEQRISFAWGNGVLANPSLTREDVERAAREMAAESKGKP